MAVNLSLFGGAGVQFFDNSGNPLTGGKIFTYAAGTTTPQATYTQPTGSPIPSHTNPIILDSAGRVPSGGEIWLTNGLSYKFLLKDFNDVQIGSYDNVSGANYVTASQVPFTGVKSQSGYVQDIADNDGSDWIGFKASGTGVLSTGYSVQDKLRQTVSVKDFGAVGDGVTDDTTAIQNALNAASVVECTELAQGLTVYLFSATLKIPSNTKLIIPTNVKLKLKDASNVNLIENKNGTGGDSNIQIVGGGTIDGNSANQSANGYGFYMRKVNTLLIDNIKVTNTRDWGAIINGCSNLIFQNNELDGTNCINGAGGFAVNAHGNGTANTSGHRIIGNYIHDWGGASGAQQFGDGIIYQNSGDIMVANNYITGCNRIGIVFEVGTRQAAAIGNVVNDNGRTATNPPAGIWVENAEDIVIANNTIDQNNLTVTNRGIVTYGSTNAIINGNIIRGSTSFDTTYGILIGSNNVTVTNNEITRVVRGIFLSGSAGSFAASSVFSENRISDATDGIFCDDVQPGDNIVITNNIMGSFNNSGNGISFLYGSIKLTDSIISGNNISAPGNDGIRVYDSLRVNFTNNVVRNAGNRGLAFSIGSTDSNIMSNIITGSATSNYVVATLTTCNYLNNI